MMFLYLSNKRVSLLFIKCSSPEQHYFKNCADSSVSRFQTIGTFFGKVRNIVVNLQDS